MGQAAATVEQMQSYIKMTNPKVSDSVIKMIPLYISEGAIEGVRGDVDVYKRQHIYSHGFECRQRMGGYQGYLSADIIHHP